MKILLDIQGMQTQSRFRGIGNYCRQLAKAICRNAPENDEIHIIYNGSHPNKETIDNIRREFNGIIQREYLHGWYPPCETGYNTEITNREVAEKLYSSYVNFLCPDALVVLSNFEGIDEDFCSTFKGLSEHIIKICISYDFIPIEWEDWPGRNWYLERLNNLRQSDLLFGISDFTNAQNAIFAPNIQSISISSDVSEIFSLSEKTAEIEKLKSKYGIQSRYILYTGGTDDRKNVISLILAYAKLPDEIKDKVDCVIVCGKGEERPKKLKELIKKVGLNDLRGIRMLGYVSEVDLCDLYRGTECFVFPSLSEGFGLPVLEAMRCGAPVIGSNKTSIPEIIGWKDALFDPNNVDALQSLIQKVLTDKGFKEACRKNSDAQQKKFSWNSSATKALNAIKLKVKEKRYSKHKESFCFGKFIKEIGSIPCNIDKMALAVSIARTFDTIIRPQLFIDVSVLVRIDSGTGIQRVVKNIVGELFKNGQTLYDIRPIYWNSELNVFCYARDFCLVNFNKYISDIQDSPIDYTEQDIYFGLDLTLGEISQSYQMLKDMQRHGVEIAFNVYDIIPILYPHYTPRNIPEAFLNWINLVSTFDHLIFNTKSALERYKIWKSNQESLKTFDPKLSFYHLGADLESSMATKGIPVESKEILMTLKSRPTFLAVSTIEPRKGYKQLLDAFELLWKDNINCNLVIVGRKGWNVEQIINRINSHDELNKRLFWLNGISDQYLTEVYKASNCVINASEAEGFGLSLIEASYHSKPLIVRNIPEFREIAKEYAMYFEGITGKELAIAVTTWLDEHSKNPSSNIFKSEKMSYYTWEESVEALLKVII